MARMYGWTFTLNNYGERDILNIKGMVGQRGIKYVCFGREIGDSGTPHLQGYLQSTQKQLTRLLLAFGNAKPHLERQKGNTGPTDAEINREGEKPFTAVGYCMKDGDFWENGTKENLEPTRQGQRMDLEGAMTAVKEGVREIEMYEKHTQVMARYPRLIERYTELVQEEEAMHSLRTEYSAWSLNRWQDALRNTLEQDPDPRQIHWIWSTEGEMGKSGMAMWLAVMKDAFLVTPERKGDMAHAFAKSPKKIVVFDCTRATEAGSIGPSYSIAEQFKNGFLFSPKFNSRRVVFKKPHVVFFANFSPDMKIWSEDRYIVTKLDQGSL